MMMVAAFLIGIPASFTATRDFISWASPWGVQPIHLAFWLLGIGAVYTTIVQGIRIKGLESRRPDIIAEPKVYNDRAILEVHNIGGEADVTAKARIIATVPEPESYTMYWESVGTTNCHIDGGEGIASILVGKLARQDHLTGDIATTIFKGGLELFKMGTSGEQVFPTFSGEISKEIRNGVEIISGRPIDRCTVEIMLTATPKLKRKWGTHKYNLEINKGEIVFDEIQD